ncbi:RDD family protein [Yoonia sp.]|uniref:RDD family protein n=1 Tax=Yoonia sp. TaxID=2212373 RepID=UPI0023B38FD0
MPIETNQYPTRFSSAHFAGVPLKRGIAWVFDVVLIAILSALILPFTAFTGIFFFPVMMLVIGFLYRWFTIAGSSATWGMRIMGIGLRDLDGAPLTSGMALAHTTGYTVSVAMAPLQLVSVILMLVTARGQGLSDHVLGTRAINLPR